MELFVWRLMFAICTAFGCPPSLVSAASDEPQVFAPGVISGAAHDSAPAFTPDGRTVYFGRANNAADFILVSHLANGKWSEPKIAPFSGKWLDMEPALAPDGTYLIFASNRPGSPGMPPIDGTIDGKPKPGRGSNLWRVNRTRDGWSQPVRLPNNINSTNSTYSPSVASNGDLYFMRSDGERSRFRILKASWTSQGYEAPTPLSFSDGQYTDVDPAVAPDQSFMVFGSERHANKDIDLFLVFRRAGQWGEPIYLGDKINGPTSDAEPRLGPDRHTLYFSSERLARTPQPIPNGEAGRILREMNWNNGLYNIWMVDLTPWLARGG
jgi:Tol biopolymer transport system component